MKATYIVNQESVLTALMTMLKANWKQFFDKGKALDVNVSIHKDSRTLRQNAHQHWLYQRIAEQAWVDGKQHEMVVWKEYLKRKFLPCIELPGGAIMAHPTHKLDYEPAQDFIRNIEAYAVELGVILPEYRSF